MTWILNAAPGVKKGNKKSLQEILDTGNIHLQNKVASKRKSTNQKLTLITNTFKAQNKTNIAGFQICASHFNVPATDILIKAHNHFITILRSGKVLIDQENGINSLKNRRKTNKSQTLKELSQKQYPKVQIISDLKKLVYIQKGLNKSVVRVKPPSSKVNKVVTYTCTSRVSTVLTTCKPTLPIRKKSVKLGRFSKKSKKPKTLKKVRRRVKRIKVLVSKNDTTTGKMGLSADDFIFKPDIPITEANYPLENINKNDLYAQDSQLDKVISLGFTDPAIKNYIKFPSVSKIIEETISDKTRQILTNWRQKMVDDLGEDGFYNHSEGLKTRGIEFHVAVKNAVLGKAADPNCSEVTQNSLKSLSWVLSHIHSPMAVESTIAHPKLGYRGVADCIAMFKNIPVIIDWKLSDKPKRDLKDTYDAPVQITAYIGALNHDPNYKWGVNHGLVAVAYANGDPCDVFLLAPKHCQIYWRHWLMRFDKFKARSHLHLDHNIDEKALECI